MFLISESSPNENKNTVETVISRLYRELKESSKHLGFSLKFCLAFFSAAAASLIKLLSSVYQTGAQLQQVLGCVKL